MKTMSKAVTIQGIILLLFSGIFAGALSAQPANIGFVLDSVDQPVFWKNIEDFKPQPLEKKGSIATFSRDSTLTLVP